ncbi:hypothetical protein [Pseudomonas saliphila]|uniref:hypothetical protein n=1 Tax=Pseudomonas saliphila TaxID=2586906 RepID=UPI00123A4E58|nr:hypothetical protein [Pseudomonas saliphila]
MTIRNSLAIACVLSAFALPTYAQTCTPEDAMHRAEVAAETINRIADNDPEKAAALHQKLLDFQERDPTRDRHSACEAYDRIIAELEREDEQAE